MQTICCQIEMTKVDAVCEHKLRAEEEEKKHAHRRKKQTNAAAEKSKQRRQKHHGTIARCAI